MKRTITSSITIDASPDEVWEVLNDSAAYPEWVEFIDRNVEVPEGEFGLGSTYREYGGIRPFVSEIEWVVTGFEPMSRQVHTGTDVAMNHELTIELTPADGGTRVDATQHMTPKWFAIPVSLAAWPLFLGKKGQAMMDATMSNLKTRVESSG